MCRRHASPNGAIKPHQADADWLWLAGSVHRGSRSTRPFILRHPASMTRELPLRRATRSNRGRGWGGGGRGRMVVLRNCGSCSINRAQRLLRTGKERDTAREICNERSTAIKRACSIYIGPS